ncbi:MULTISPECIES: tRNA-binding protein [Sphingobacterium]|uniref:tRNA-binding protein n=1 Tax=Sphingobacterium cellulitidis TaxID=1768011 RepID=A0A8H9G0U5_9SPHI|nr:MULTISPECIES: tRNA-binding protein [Sphingobacterium]MBA8987938.1 tRNA-binding protein [Sphingobacterium soli]OYD41325.1 tRNA-binding protein [Sphingobacterium cellulitidis]OYD45912.1 tRNA-binding protein [Sphingobacterium cellulitidis]WFB62892.1 tRNA-binding protein [Sphingobacterium sp. WM]GGE26011.1 tRNA-binding protein [Sphingobacterium soli]
MEKLISWDEFEQVDLRVGTILEVADFPKAKRPAYQILVDFGPEIGTRKSSAQITKHYSKEELLGKQVVAVVNFPKKQIANFMSECLVTGFEDENGDIILTTVERGVPNGAKLK